MPLYEYYCDKCRKRFEAIVNRNYKDAIMCTDCKKVAKRLVSACTHKIEGYCYKNEYPKEPKNG